jgi:predicted RNA-binding protein with PIN domain
MSNREGKKALLLVDGYNVIRTTNRYLNKFDSHTDYDGAYCNPLREALISDVATYAQNRYEAYVVFDGAGNPNSSGEPAKIAGVNVIFSEYGKDADSVLERLAFEGRQTGKRVVVVSSDSSIQNVVLSNEIVRMSSLGFASELETIGDESKDEQTRTSKMTLEQRLDKETAKKLQALLKRK